MNWFKARRGKNPIYDRTVSVPGHPLDARHANPSIKGSMANEIEKLKEEFEKKLENALEWHPLTMISGLGAGVQEEINIPINAKEVWLIAGGENNIQVFGGISVILPKSRNQQNIFYHEQVYDASGNHIASGFYAFYDNNTLRVSMREVTGIRDIAIRVYIR